MLSFLSNLRLCGFIILFIGTHILEAKSNNRGLSGCLLSLVSQAESSNPHKTNLFSRFGFRRTDELFDSSLVSEKVYTSMISYYIENEVEFGFQDSSGVAKNFIDLSADEYVLIKEAMAKEVEQSDLGNAHLRAQVAKAIRDYDVPRDYREFQRRQRAAVISD